MTDGQAIKERSHTAPIWYLDLALPVLIFYMLGLTEVFINKSDVTCSDRPFQTESLSVDSFLRANDNDLYLKKRLTGGQVVVQVLLGIITIETGARRWLSSAVSPQPCLTPSHRRAACSTSARA